MFPKLGISFDKSTENNVPPATPRGGRRTFDEDGPLAAVAGKMPAFPSSEPIVTPRDPGRGCFSDDVPPSPRLSSSEPAFPSAVTTAQLARLKLSATEPKRPPASPMGLTTLLIPKSDDLNLVDMGDRLEERSHATANAIRLSGEFAAFNERIFVGGVTFAANTQNLLENGIRFVSALVETKGSLMTERQELGITTYCKPIDDSDTPIKDMTQFPATMKNIIAPIVAFLKTQPGKVLVHCHMGANRSAGVAIGVLVALGMNIDSAEEAVRNSRGDYINPNEAVMDVIRYGLAL